MTEGRFSAGQIYVQYLGEYDEDKTELEGISAPNVPGMAGTTLPFRRHDNDEGGIEAFPSEKVALGWMRSFNYGRPDPLFKIRYDYIDDAQRAAIGEIVQEKVDSLKETGYFDRLVRSIVLVILKKTEKKPPQPKPPKPKADPPPAVGAAGNGK